MVQSTQDRMLSPNRDLDFRVTSKRARVLVVLLEDGINLRGG
jgi:hypothetical protein